MKALKESKTGDWKSWKMFILFLCISIYNESGVVAQQKTLDWLIDTSDLNDADATGEHPRGLLLPEEVQMIRAKVAENPDSGLLSQYNQEVGELFTTLSQEQDAAPRQVALLAEKLAILYLFTGKDRFADQAFSQLTRLFEDEIIFNNPVSRGLTRAAVLRSLAITYDFCYNGWSQEKRNQVNRQLYKLTFTTQANMGAEANYSLVSNWMGVRWGASLFAGMVWDNPHPDSPSIMDPLVWDATKRLMDHMKENTYPEGWNAESIGYHLYNWSFIGPALIAFQNRRQNRELALDILAPHTRQSIKAMAATMVSIPVREGLIGMKPDLSDDNLNLGTGFLGMAFRLYPGSQLSEIKWMHDYLGDSSLYSILYYPEEIAKKNPADSGWLTHADTTQGVVVFRNRFANEKDVVAVFNTSSTRIAGHKGPDVNTFRIIGGGVPLVIGAGRTGKIAGQTNIFPHKPKPEETGHPDAGNLVTYQFGEFGSGFAVGEGSSMGVIRQRRKFTVNYDERSGAEAVFLVEDMTENGGIWRLNTPEFNEIVPNEKGYEIHTPTGYTLHVMVLGSAKPVEVNQTSVAYGGNLSRLNPGIIWHGKSYTHSKAIDLKMNGNLSVLMILQAPDKPQPKVEYLPENGHLSVGELTVALEINNQQ
ncbi:hypothetical protein [Cyclobacterium roseum]|uniref:hypothetical protein n=1 Tax=Cyclobacterium roseum TaxID=2666137 RepID=UPI0013912C16|nr:hypothetical protein [Cyclobacterium roseum]